MSLAQPKVMGRFPHLSVVRCTMKGCHASGNEETVCHHNIQELLESSGFSPEREKKKVIYLKTCYHPDRFSVCKEDLQDDLKQQADLFLGEILQPWYEEL